MINKFFSQFFKPKDLKKNFYDRRYNKQWKESVS